MGDSEIKHVYGILHGWLVTVDDRSMITWVEFDETIPMKTILFI